MAKIVKDSHTVGEAGVLLFNQYCNKHKPYIIFREVTKHDFGIDGEIEMTLVNSEGKTEATGEITKIQIKSVNSDNSYIRNESKTKFDFYADKDDIDYWQSHKKHGIDVLLVIVDIRSDIIYLKKIGDLEINSSKAKKKKLPLVFIKAETKVEIGKNDFLEKFGKSFKPRINYNVEEELLFNCLKVKKYPRIIYLSVSKFTNKKEVFKNIDGSDAPHFVMKGNLIFTFEEIKAKNWGIFYDDIIDKEFKSELISYQKITESLEYTNIFLELIYEHIKYDMNSKRMYFSKEYHKFYFTLPQDKEFLEVKTKTRKRDSDSIKKVVQYYEYGKYKFYRHHAVELKIKFIEDGIYLIVNPKYYFTKDRREPLEPEQITKFTNYLTSREYNIEYTNQLHFWKTFLFSGSNEWKLYVNEKMDIVIGEYEVFNVPFGIFMDIKVENKSEMDDEQLENKQITLF